MSFKNSIIKSDINDKQVAFWYLGQESFLFKFKGKYIVVDPYLSDYVDKNCSQIVKWKRKYNPPIKGSELDFVDGVLLTHSHYDHADPWTIKDILSKNNNCLFIAPKAEKDIYLSYGIEENRFIGVNAGEQIKIFDFLISPVPSAHQEFHTDKSGNYKELGYIIKMDNIKMFHAGDTNVYDGLSDYIYKSDIAFMPINGGDYFRTSQDIIGNMTAEEAVKLAKISKVNMIVPMHFDLYDVNKADGWYFAKLSEENKMNFHIFNVKERYIYMK